MLKQIARATSSGCLRWVPMVSNICALVSIASFLGTAGNIYGATNVMDWPDSPAISQLAETTETFPLFAAGFTVLSAFLGCALVCRASHLHVACTTGGQRCVNFLWVALAVVALPGILMMAFNRDDGPNGTLHFLGAGIGMGLICVSGIVHALFCLTNDIFDRNVPSTLRSLMYVTQGLGLMTAVITFGMWFVSDKSSAKLEWIGFILAMVSYASYCVLYAYPPLSSPSTITASGTEHQGLLK
eukprot:m.258043 g.258043  ORF g.258043 m.258043 type:complete len:243 (-) comp36036_c0_seq1:224-952(-)